MTKPQFQATVRAVKIPVTRTFASRIYMNIYLNQVVLSLLFSFLQIFPGYSWLLHQQSSPSISSDILLFYRYLLPALPYFTFSLHEPCSISPITELNMSDYSGSANAQAQWAIASRQIQGSNRVVLIPITV